jgi:hypothetical protein
MSITRNLRASVSHRGAEGVATLARTLRAFPRPDVRPEPRDAAEWLRANGVTLAALTLIAIQLWWKAALLAHSYFRQDDYRFIDHALASGFDWKYLMAVQGGHLLPAGMAIAWLVARASLYNWPLTCAVTVVLLAAGCLAMLRMLRTLFGNRPAILIPLAVFLFCPLSLAGLDWWSVSLEVLPLELATFLAVDAHVRYVRGGRLRDALAAAAWVALAMLSMDKGAVVPLLLLGLTSAFFVEGRWAAAAVRALARYWKAWALYAVLLAGYCVAFFIQLPGSSTQPGDPGSASHVLDLASAMVGTTLLPGSLGGPWQWSAVGYAQASPPAALQQLSWAVAALVVVVSCACRARGWRAWALLLGWFLAADIVPVVLGRLGDQPAALLGAQTRYLTDALPVLALCVGLGFLPLAGERDAYRFRRPAAPEVQAGTAGRAADPAVAAGQAAPAERALRYGRAAALLVLAAFFAGSFWSLQALESVTAPAAARSYIATARAAVAGAPRGTLVVDAATPGLIMDPSLFWRQGYTSQVIGPIARDHPASRLSWTLSPRGTIGSLMIFDEQGRLRQAAVLGPSSGPPPGRRGCWAVPAAGAIIPLHGTLYRWPWTVLVQYSGPAAVLQVGLVGTDGSGSDWSTVTLAAGSHAAYAPVLGAGSGVMVRVAGSGPAPCVTGVTVGSLQPAQAGRAIPAAPVRG